MTGTLRPPRVRRRGNVSTMGMRYTIKIRWRNLVTPSPIGLLWLGPSPRSELLQCALSRTARGVAVEDGLQLRLVVDA